jgi:hypothetical protein
MRTKLLAIGGVCAASLILWAGVEVQSAAHAYIQPDLSERTTESLRWEIIELGMDGATANVVSSELIFRRQRTLLDEVIRRTKVEADREELYEQTAGGDAQAIQFR